MSLHDVDKGSDARKLPVPNTNDQVNVRMAHGTTGFTLKLESTASDTARLVVKDGRLLLTKNGVDFIDVSDGNIAVNDRDGTNNTQIGYLPDGTGGFVAVRNGLNVNDVF